MKFVVRTVLLVGFCIATSVGASDFGPARSELERFSNKLDRFQADFTQTVKSQDGRIQDQTQGQVWLQSPDKLRWVYSGDFPEVIVADGKNIWIYDESLEQVTVKPQSDQVTDSPLMILGDVSQLDEQFQVTELGEFEDMLLLELKSLDSETEFERVLLGLVSDGVRMMALEDAFGQRTEIYFENVLMNPPADPELYIFTPPEGTDVVGVAALPE
ncbi:MAG: outer membrane lipoprotein chaperone LolA [Xanthomonadales bacterium]|nr:outer membrane lipoprotein chaperone LolA [Xanthomonadales bacterium]